MSAILLCITLVIGLGAITSNYRSIDATTTFRAVAEQDIETLEEDSEDWRRTRDAEAIDDKSEENDEICYTPGCIESASTILKNMDPNVDPCHDFHKFVCGSFLNTTIVPDDQFHVDAFSTLETELQNQLKSIMEQEIGPDESRVFRLTKTLYKSCMNETTIRNKGLKPLRKILKKIGGWPVLEGNLWKDDDFDWKETVYKLRKAGFSANSLIDLTVEADEKNSTRHRIYLDSAFLDLPQEHLSKSFDDSIILSYYSYMVGAAMTLGAPKDRAVSELKESLLFEMKLANISLPKEKRRNATMLYNPMTLTELATDYPKVPWREYIGKILPPEVTLEEDEIVIAMVPRYFGEMEKLLDTAPKRTQANYLVWRAVMASVSYLDDDIREKQLKYLSVLMGKTKRESRWQECMTVVSENLPIGIGAMYVRKYFNETAKQNVNDIVMEMRQQLKNTLKQVDWMDNKTKQKALEKAAAITNLIGYADELLDDRKLDEIFKTLELSEENYLENALNLFRFNVDYSLGLLRKPVKKDDVMRQGNPATVNAFYNPQRNSIQLPAGILQGGFFSIDRPKYMNYGAIGWAIGHELTHGFDDEGRQYDEKGNIDDWWEPLTNQKYLERAQCIINQYGNYTVEEIGRNVNGISTQGENIADIGGIKIAYLAYNNWANEHAPEKKLPGLPYAPKQMLWISATTIYCSKLTPEVKALLMTIDGHSPPEYRVLGSLSNIPEFSQNFNCTLGSRMNPVKKCTIW